MGNTPTHFARNARSCRGLVVCAALVLLGACGTQFAYNRLAWLGHYYLANQVSLDEPQSTELRANLREFFVWHRRTELPRYAAFLDRMATASGHSMTREQLLQQRVEIEAFVRVAVERGAPDAARWLRGLRPAQLDELFASFEKKEREAREESCGQDAAKRSAKREERFIDNVEDWTGRLSRAQRELIVRGLSKTRGDACLDVTARERSRIEFRALVERHREDADFAARIATFMTRPEDRWDPAYRATAEANREVLIELLAELGRSLTPEQRARSAARLRDFAGNLRVLSAQ
jgi:hypothetical protein